MNDKTEPNDGWNTTLGVLSRRTPRPNANLYWKQYLAAGSWRCEKSPTGGHHWPVEPWPGNENKAICRYCGEVRHFPKSLDNAEFTEAQRGRIERFEMG